MTQGEHTSEHGAIYRDQFRAWAQSHADLGPDIRETANRIAWIKLRADWERTTTTKELPDDWRDSWAAWCRVCIAEAALAAAKDFNATLVA